jgi:hypothetical protein
VLVKEVKHGRHRWCRNDYAAGTLGSGQHAVEVVGPVGPHAYRIRFKLRERFAWHFDANQAGAITRAHELSYGALLRIIACGEDDVVRVHLYSPWSRKGG